MKKNIRKGIATSIPDEYLAEYLRKLSQSAQNIRTIIDVHSTESYYFDKRLDSFYEPERQSFRDLLRSPLGIDFLGFNQSLLDDNLTGNDCRSPEIIDKINLAKDGLILLLRDIEKERRKIPGYKATTGLEGGYLKDYLIELVTSGKKKYNLALLDVKEIGPVTGNKHDDKIIFKDAHDDYHINENGVTRLLKLKKSTQYYKAFDTLYSLAKSGGYVSFDDFTGRAPLDLARKLKGKDNKIKCKIIGRYLTDKNNGFLRASKIVDATFNEKPLIKCELSVGITFNNKK